MLTPEIISENTNSSITKEQLHKFITTECKKYPNGTKIIYNKELNRLGKYNSIIPVLFIKFTQKATNFIIERATTLAFRIIKVINKWATDKIDKLENTVNILKEMRLIPENIPKKEVNIRDLQKIFIENNRFIFNSNNDNLSVENFLHGSKDRINTFDGVVTQTTNLILDYSSDVFLKEVLKLSTIPAMRGYLGEAIKKCFNTMKSFLLKENVKLVAHAIAFNLLKSKIQNTKTLTVEGIKSISTEINNIFDQLKSQNRLQKLTSIDQLLDMSNEKYELNNPQKCINLTKIIKDNIQLFKDSLAIAPKEEDKYAKIYADNLELFIIAIIGNIIPIVREDLASENIGFLRKIQTVKNILS